MALGGLQGLPAAAADETQVLRFACAAKSNGQLRHTQTASGCSKQESLVTLSVASPTEVCATSAGTVHRVTKTSACTKQLKGTAFTIPTSMPAYFCAQPTAALRRVAALTQCSTTDLKLVSVNNAPTGLALSPSVVTENVAVGTLVGSVSASDNDPGDSLTFSLAPGAGSQDNASFVLAGTELRTAAAVDFEAKPSYSVRLMATDAGGLSQSQAVTISVVDVPENRAPTAIGLSNAQVVENAATTVGTLTTTDPDVGDTFTYSLTSDGAPNDNALFTIAGDVLSTTGLDHEGEGPTYVVTVQTDDGHGGTLVRSFTVTATNVNEAPTAPSLDPIAFPENSGGGTVGTLSARDPDGDSLSFDLVAGPGDADNAEFTVVGADLVARAGLDFEHGPYAVRVRASDAGGLSASAALLVVPTDVNDAPTDLVLSPGVVMENQPAGTSVGTLSASDQDAGDSLTYSLVGGDTHLFAVDGDHLRTTQPLDHEEAATRTLRVRADDGRGGTVEADVTVTVVDVNEGPTGMTLSSAQVAENQPAGTAVGDLSSQDPDGGDTATYTLVAGAGDGGNDSFEIVGNELRTRAPFDFEQVDAYSIRVRATDAAGAGTEQAFTIVVTNVNEAPHSVALTGDTVPENRAPGWTVGTVSSLDPDLGDSATYSLPSGTADNAGFVLVGSTLKTAAMFDFETKASYSVVIRVADGGGLADQETFTVTVLDGNDAPTAVADSYSGVVGNTRAVLGSPSTGAHITLAGDLPVANDVDPDGDVLGAVAETRATAGGGTVTINADGSFVYTPGVGDRSQSDSFTYRVSDGEFTASGTVTVAIGPTVVWYVDNTAAGTGDGRSHSPYTSTSLVSASDDADGPGDVIFVHSSSTAYTPLALERGQSLWGQPEGLTVSGVEILAPSGANPLISAVNQVALDLVDGNDIRRVDVQASGGMGVRFLGGDLDYGANTRVSASGSASIAFQMALATGTATVGASIEGAGGTAVRVSNGGAAAAAVASFTGPVVGTNASVETYNLHAGTVVSFSGGITVDNTDRPGLAFESGGVVTVTGPGNVVRTTTGRAVTITNTRIGEAGVTLERVDANGGQTAVQVYNTGTLGSFAVTGNSTGRCGGLTGTDGSRLLPPDVSDCSGGTIRNSASGYVFVDTLRPRLTRVHVLDTAGSGISATGTNGFMLASSWLKANGANLNPSVDLGGFNGTFSGQAVVSDTTVEGSRYNGISVRALSPVTAVLSGNQVSGAARFGVELISRGAGSFDAQVTGSYFAESAGNVVAGADFVGTSGNMRIAVRDNTMAPSSSTLFGSAVNISGNPSSNSAGAWAGRVDYVVERNRLVLGSNQDGIVVASNQGASSGVLTGIVRDNLIGDPDRPDSCGGANGIWVYAQTGVNTALVTGNTLAQCPRAGITVDRLAAAATADVTVTDNTVGWPSASPWANYGVTVRSQNTGTTPACFDLRDNRVAHGPLVAEDIGIRTGGATPARLPGYTGTPTSADQISAFVGAANNAASVATTLSDGGSFTGGPGCVTPSP